MFFTKYDAENKLWKGNEVTPLYNPKVSIGEVILKALAVNGPKITQVSNPLRQNNIGNKICFCFVNCVVY